MEALIVIGSTIPDLFPQVCLVEGVAVICLPSSCYNAGRAVTPGLLYWDFIEGSADPQPILSEEVHVPEYVEVEGWRDVSDLLHRHGCCQVSSPITLRDVMGESQLLYLGVVEDDDDHAQDLCQLGGGQPVQDGHGDAH